MCRNGGTCLSTLTGPKCHCPLQFSGRQCEEEVTVDVPGFVGKFFMQHFCNFCIWVKSCWCNFERKNLGLPFEIFGTGFNNAARTSVLSLISALWLQEKMWLKYWKNVGPTGEIEIYIQSIIFKMFGFDFTSARWLIIPLILAENLNIRLCK